MARETIGIDDYLKLRGLFELAKDYNRALRRIERIAAEILEVPDDDGYFGHVSDNVTDTSPDVDGMLSDLNVKVVRNDYDETENVDESP